MHIGRRTREHRPDACTRAGRVTARMSAPAVCPHSWRGLRWRLPQRLSSLVPCSPVTAASGTPRLLSTAGHGNRGLPGAQYEQPDPASGWLSASTGRPGPGAGFIARARPASSLSWYLARSNPGPADHDASDRRPAALQCQPTCSFRTKFAAADSESAASARGQRCTLVGNCYSNGPLPGPLPGAVEAVGAVHYVCSSRCNDPGRRVASAIRVARGSAAEQGDED